MDKESRVRKIERIVICNATLMWVNPSHIPRTKFVMLSVERQRTTDKHFFTRSDPDSITQKLVSFLISEIRSERVPPTVFSCRDTFTVYQDGFWGRPIIPAELWVLYPFRPGQKKSLVNKLLDCGMDKNVIQKLGLKVPR